jgi:hypothetical protein
MIYKYKYTRVLVLNRVYLCCFIERLFSYILGSSVWAFPPKFFLRYLSHCGSMCVIPFPELEYCMIVIHVSDRNCRILKPVPVDLHYISHDT